MGLRGKEEQGERDRLHTREMDDFMRAFLQPTPRSALPQDEKLKKKRKDTHTLEVIAHPASLREGMQLKLHPHQFKIDGS